MRDVLERTRPPGRRVLRFFGASESAVAQALAEAGGDGDGVEATICARDFEIHVDLVVEPGAETRGDELAAALRAPLERYLFSEDERTIAELVLELCRARGLRLATAESCTGGMVAARLTDVPGSSDVVLGGVGRVRERGEDAPSSACPRRSFASTGRSRPRWRPRWRTACARGSARTSAIAVTGVAGPGGGSDDKPVGLVHYHVSSPDGDEGAHVLAPRRPRDDQGARDGRALCTSPDEF